MSHLLNVHLLFLILFFLLLFSLLPLPPSPCHFVPPPILVFLLYLLLFIVLFLLLLPPPQLLQELTRMKGRTGQRGLRVRRRPLLLSICRLGRSAASLTGLTSPPPAPGAPSDSLTPPRSHRCEPQKRGRFKEKNLMNRAVSPPLASQHYG